MSKPINIYYNKDKILLEDYDNIDITELDNIINYSCGFIQFNHLQSFNYDISTKLITILVNKLKLGGILVIGLENLKIISKLYTDNAISDHEFLNKVKHKESIWSPELLNDLVNKTLQDCGISKIQSNNPNHIVYITIERLTI